MAKRKTKKPSVRKPRQLKRRLKSTEYLVFRNKKGRVTKHRANSKLVAEVRSRKTKKVVGYIGKFTKASRGKPARPIHTKLTKSQRGFIKTRISVSRPKPRSGRLTRDLSFTLHSSESINAQVSANNEFYQGSMEAVRLLGPLKLYMDISVNDLRHISHGIHIENDRWNKTDFVNVIVSEIMNGVDAMKIRFSPKKIPAIGKKRRRRLEKKITRSLRVTVSFEPWSV